MKRTEIQQRVADFLTRVCPTADPCVVAVSGGADSVALLLLLASLTDRQLVVAHLNHQLRGTESDADEAFVLDLAGRLAAERGNVTWSIHRLEINRLAGERRESIEKAARELRYEWLSAVARAAGAAWLATGHTADDQAETVLHRLLRGTGLHGLAGIPARRPLTAGIEVIRPLLTSTRADVLAYLGSQGQCFRQDTSNADPSFTRNRIRHELLPKLERTYNPSIVSVLCSLAEQARAVQEGVRAEAGRLLREVELPRAGNVLVFQAPLLEAAPRNLVREMFRLVWEREHWPVGAMSFAHWDRLAALTQADAGTWDLPDGIRASRHGRIIQVGPPFV